MNKYIRIITVLLLLCVFSCSKESISDSNLFIVEIPRGTNIVSDGESQLKFIVVFNEEADITKIDASASITNGKFLSNNEQSTKLIPKKGDQSVETARNKITASETIISSTRDRPYVLIVEVNGYISRIPIKSVRSLATSLTLTANKFSVKQGFNDQISLTALLKNSSNRKVSENTKVLLNDYFFDGRPMNGRFSSEVLSSSEDGSVNTNYSPGFQPSNEDILITATVLDTLERPTIITDTLKIYVEN